MLDNGAKNQTADPAKAVDRDADGRETLFPSISIARLLRALTGEVKPCAGPSAA